VGVRWLLSLAKSGFGGILADEMGLGKTAQSLVFLDLLKTLTQDLRLGPCLVVIPAAVIENWERECTLWCPHFGVLRYHAQSQKPGKQRYELGQRFMEQMQDGRTWLVLTTAAILRNQEDRNFFFRRLDFECILYDEAHSLRNAATNAFKHIDRGIAAKRRVLLTGTPVHNSLEQLGNLLKLVLNGAGSKKVHEMIKELDGIIERQALQTLQVRAAPFMMRRLKKDVMSELPTKTAKLLRCDLTPRQRKLYEAEIARVKDGSSKLKKAQKRKQLKGLFCTLRRLCNHPLLGQARFSEDDYQQIAEGFRLVRKDWATSSSERCIREIKEMDDFTVLSEVKKLGLQKKLAGMGVQPAKLQVSTEELLDSGKLTSLMKILEGQRAVGQKTLVFSQFTMYLDIIEAVFNLKKVNYARLDGVCSFENRQSSIDQFQKGDLDVFLLSMKAGGTGLNLTAADHVVLMDLSWNPQDNRQAEDRTHRLGQARPVTVTYISVSDTIEEKIVKCNAAKMQLDYKFGGQKSNVGSAFDASDSDAGDAGADAGEGEACAELGQELGIL
ncbi:unnamed protein product, partial [Effrenium voratum]